LTHASLAGAVAEWEASDRNPDYLVRGTRLAEFEKFAGTGLIDLNAYELDYLGAALERRTLEIETEEQRIAAKDRLERRAKRRLGGLVAIIAIVLGIVAIGAAVFLLSDVPTVAIIGTPPEDDPDQPGGYQALLRSGFLQAGAVHDFEGVEVRWPFTDTEQAIENVVADGTDLVVTSDFWGPSTVLMDRYPETMFVILDRYARNVAGLPNEVGVTYAIEEGAFMAGAAAALVTDTGIVGYVGAGPIVDAVEPARAGFVAGVEYVDPGIEVLTINKGAGITPEEAEQAAKEAANHLYDQGADVILELTRGMGWVCSTPPSPKARPPVSSAGSSPAVTVAIAPTSWHPNSSRSSCSPSSARPTDSCSLPSTTSCKARSRPDTRSRGSATLVTR
jgi:hypothetical protein